ncbi:hypothetical protein FSP39_020058 [Pinctada imbricata]|uniref:Uncharacterized protein n=1 Tax=Pinctada imbricata TaxID=66713 RepID=A0AA89BZT9_PINIB|nr:hypothetical protein FSP39_020058 [Pinctada imbricata]
MTSISDGPREDYEEVNSETKTGDSDTALSIGRQLKKKKLEKYLYKPAQIKENSGMMSNDVTMASISDEPREIYEELSSETKTGDSYTTLSMGKKPKQKKLEKCPEKPALLRETPGGSDEIRQIEGYTSGSRLMTPYPPVQLSCKIKQIKSWTAYHSPGNVLPLQK